MYSLSSLSHVHSFMPPAQPIHGFSAQSEEGLAIREDERVSGEASYSGIAVGAGAALASHTRVAVGTAAAKRPIFRAKRSSRSSVSPIEKGSSSDELSGKIIIETKSAISTLVESESDPKNLGPGVIYRQVWKVRLKRNDPERTGLEVRKVAKIDSSEIPEFPEPPENELFYEKGKPMWDERLRDKLIRCVHHFYKYCGKQERRVWVFVGQTFTHIPRHILRPKYSAVIKTLSDGELERIVKRGPIKSVD